MKRIFFILAVSASLLSCEMGDPLDPAKGIDSQGDSTLFSGTVIHNGMPVTGAVVECYELDWSGDPTGSVRWSATTDSDGKYFKRDDLKSVYYGVRVSCGIDYQNITGEGTVDYDSTRQSPYDPVVIVDLQI